MEEAIVLLISAIFYGFMAGFVLRLFARVLDVLSSIWHG